MGIREFMTLYPIKDGETGLSAREVNGRWPYFCLSVSPSLSAVQVH